MTQPSPIPQHHWPRYSLRRLLGCMLILCILLAAGRWVYVRMILPKYVVAELKASQYVEVGYTIKGVVCVELGVPFASDREADRIIKLLHQLPHLAQVKAYTVLNGSSNIEEEADHQFAAVIDGLRVRSVVVQSKLAGKQTAGAIAGNQRVTSVTYEAVPTAQQLATVCQSRHVEELEFRDVELPAENLRSLAAVKHLRKITLACKFPCEELAELGQLQTCDLYLKQTGDFSEYRSQISDDDLRNYVAPLPNLVLLDLSGEAPSDEAMNALSQAPRLRWLFLRDARIGDSGVGRLADSPALAVIDLGGTQVTEAGLASLARCKTLRSLAYPHRLDGERIRQSLPNVKRMFKDDHSYGWVID